MSPSRQKLAAATDAFSQLSELSRFCGLDAKIPGDGINAASPSCQRPKIELEVAPRLFRCYEIFEATERTYQIEAKRIRKTAWRILHIRVCIEAAFQSDRICGNKPPLMRVVPAGLVIHQSRQRFSLTTGVVVSRQPAAGALTKDLILDSLEYCAGPIQQCCCASEVVLQEILLAGGARLPKLLINPGAVGVIHHTAVASLVQDPQFAKSGSLAVLLSRVSRLPQQLPPHRHAHS